MRVLVVEDDLSLADALRRGLKEHGYAVDVAHDGQEALEHTLTTPYDMLILDVLVPRMDGFTVCRRLRERGHATPVLMLTARDAVDDRVSGLDAGADDYLTKPFAFASSWRACGPCCDAEPPCATLCCALATWSWTRPRARCGAAASSWS